MTTRDKVEATTHLVFSSLPSIRTFHVHYHDIRVLGLAHPDTYILILDGYSATDWNVRTLRCLLTLRFVHDIEISAKEAI